MRQLAVRRHDGVIVARDSLHEVLRTVDRMEDFSGFAGSVISPVLPA